LVGTDFKLWTLNFELETPTFGFWLKEKSTVMLKYFLIVSIVVYVFYKIGSFFFRAGAAAQQLRNHQRRDADAGKTPGPKVKKGKVNGGEYIDYEEVK
jgi:hypothetical protein